MADLNDTIILYREVGGGGGRGPGPSSTKKTKDILRFSRQRDLFLLSV